MQLFFTFGVIESVGRDLNNQIYLEKIYGLNESESRQCLFFIRNHTL